MKIGLLVTIPIEVTTKCDNFCLICTTHAPLDSNPSLTATFFSLQLKWVNLFIKGVRWRKHHKKTNNFAPNMSPKSELARPKKKNTRMHCKIWKTVKMDCYSAMASRMTCRKGSVAAINVTSSTIDSSKSSKMKVNKRRSRHKGHSLLCSSLPSWIYLALQIAFLWAAA